MSTLDELEHAFGSATSAGALVPHSASGTPPAPDTYDRRLRSLLLTDSGRYDRCLQGAHDYPSDSEASLAVVAAMVLRHFTDEEVWWTLETSALFARRVAAKGEHHARNLYAAEIAKARMTVRPFTYDPALRRTSPRVVSADVTHAAWERTIDPAAAAAPPLDEEPLPTGDDFVSRYVHYALQRTDAPRAAHELMAVVVLSTLAGPRPVLPIATAPSGWRLCLWGMFIVNSTTGRKTTVINVAKDVIAAVLGADALIEWEGSPQGLLQRLQDRDGQSSVFARDEYSGLMAQVNRAGGHLAGLPQLFIKAFDGGVLENVRTRKRRTKDGPLENDTDRVQTPYLTKLTASTFDAFVQRCTIDNVLDGFLARFIFVTGAARPRRLRVLTTQLATEREQLLDHARRLARRAESLGLLDLDPSVLDCAWEVEQKWLEVAERTTRPDAAGPAFKRLHDTVLKIAALLAIDGCPEGRTPRVTPRHFAAALAMGERWRVSTLQVIDALGATSFMRDVDAVAATVRAHAEGIAVRDLWRTHRRLRQRDFDEILETLEQREEIEVVELRGAGHRGRPPRVVYPFGQAPPPAVAAS